VQADRQLKNVQHQLQQEKTRSQIKEEAFEREKQLWATQEEVSKSESAS
jgi:hypothetical protein